MVGGDLGSLLLAKAAGKVRKPDWDSQYDQCRFPARRHGEGGSGTRSRRCSVPAPTPAQPGGGPRGAGAGWAAWPWLRSPRDITAQARRLPAPAAATGQAGGAGEAPRLWGTGSVRGDPLHPGRAGREQGEAGGGLVCTHTHTQPPCMHSHVHMRVHMHCLHAGCTCAPSQPHPGVLRPLAAQGVLSPCPRGTPGPRRVPAPHPGHAATAHPPPGCGHTHQLRTHACTPPACSACTRVCEGPGTRVGRRAASEQRCGAGGSGVGPAGGVG